MEQSAPRPIDDAPSFLRSLVYTAAALAVLTGGVGALYLKSPPHAPEPEVTVSR